MIQFVSASNFLLRLYFPRQKKMKRKDLSKIDQKINSEIIISAIFLVKASLLGQGVTGSISNFLEAGTASLRLKALLKVDLKPKGLLQLGLQVLELQPLLMELFMLYFNIMADPDRIEYLKQAGISIAYGKNYSSYTVYYPLLHRNKIFKIFCMDGNKAPIYEKESQEKLEKQRQLKERLKRLQENGKAFMKKVDDKINNIEDIKATLKKQGQQMEAMNDRFVNVIKMMGQNLARSMGNTPMRSNPNESNTSQDRYQEFQPVKGQISVVTEKIKKCKEICIITGAGVSKGSGIPTFRGPEGIYKNNFVINEVQYSPQQFLTSGTQEQYPLNVWKWVQKFRALIHSKQPCQEHYLIDKIIHKFTQAGIKTTLVTTNIDGYHSKTARKSQKKYFCHQIHGNVDFLLCLNCGLKSELKLKNVILPPVDFHCQKCGGIKFRPWIMFFDDIYDTRFDPESLKNKQFALTICIGTSLETNLSRRIALNSIQVVEINPQCNLKSGKVDQFSEEALPVLRKILEKFEQ